MQKNNSKRGEKYGFTDNYQESITELDQELYELR